MFRSDVGPYYQLGNRKLTCPSNPIVCVLRHRVRCLLPRTNKFPVYFLQLRWPAGNVLMITNALYNETLTIAIKMSSRNIFKIVIRYYLLANYTLI